MKNFVPWNGRRPRKYLTIRDLTFLVLLCFSSPLTAENHLGNYAGFTQRGNIVTLQSDTSSMRITFYTPDVIRLDFLPFRSSVPDSSFAVIREATDTVPISLIDHYSSLLISSSLLRVECRKFPLRISILDTAGNTLISEPRAGGFAADGAQRKVQFTLTPDVHFYGTGERGTSLDKRGQSFECYNTQVGGYQSPLPTMNLNVPFIASTGGYAIYVDNTYKGKFDLGASDSSIFSYTAAGGEISCFVLAAKTIPKQLEKYTWLTGRQPLPPRWAFGFIQSKNRYSSETEARAIVDTIREKSIPCDGLVLDLQWFENMGDLRWNNKLWPHPDSMMSDFLARGIKTILITEPYLVELSPNFREAETLGYLAKDSTGQSYLLDHWWSCRGCNAALLDLTNPSARAWWWTKHPGFLGNGAAGLWTDLGEPERHPDNMIHFLGSARKIHNIYNLVWAKTIFDGFLQYRPGKRVFNLTRSGFAGSQRFGVIPWSGDVARDFGGLAVQLPMLLNMGMSGFGYHNSDIGGYARNPTTPELYVRWMEYGTFCPITRAHGAGESVHGFPTEPWRFGPEAEKICKTYLNLRYRLLPYNYTLAHENYATGMPLARPLFWENPRDSDLINESSTYFWGDDFLVSPVVAGGQTLKEVLIPGGKWFNFWTDEVVEGKGKITVPAPLETLPIFVRAGSIIPLAPIMNYSDERPLDTLTLLVYPADSGISSSTLYEDDGTTTAYQSGEFAVTIYTQVFRVTEAGSAFELTIGPSVGSFRGKLLHRVYDVELHSLSGSKLSVDVNRTLLHRFRSQSDVPAHTNGFSYNADKHILNVLVSCGADSTYRISFRGVIPKK